MKKLRLLGCGGRDWTDGVMIRRVIEGYAKRYDIEVMIHGANRRGADAIIEGVCHSLGIKTDPTPAEWHLYHRGAGPKRNALMLTKKPDKVIGFKDNFDTTLKHGGTENMIKQAVAAYVDWQVWRHDGPELNDFFGLNLFTVPE